MLGGRVTAAEGELRNKASKADLTKMKTELEDCVRRDHVDKLQALVNKVRDEASDRIDGIAERTFNMRKELDSSLDQMTATNELMQKRVDEKTGALEEQATEVAAFLSRAEKQIGEKVSNDELTRVTKAFAEQLQETRNVLQAQMDVVRGRAERSTEDFMRVVGKMDLVAMRVEVTPIAEDVKKLQNELAELTTEVGTKAADEAVATKLEEILGVQGEHGATLLTKADADAVQDRHERHVTESANALNGLREVTEHLGISINSVEESVNLVAAQTGTKAETRDVHEIMKMNEAVQSQVTGLKSELQGTLKALETWILEQNTKQTHGMKLQPKPADEPPGSSKSGRAAGGAPRPADPAKEAPANAPIAAAPHPANQQLHNGDEKLLMRVIELERQLAETQKLLYAQASAASVRGGGDGGPFGGNFAPPSGVPTSYALGAGKLDASGAFMMPSGDAAQSYAAQLISPRPPPRRKAHGGGQGVTSSFAAGTVGKVAGGGGGDGVVGPPFQSQADRRQWLLQEKRRWLVEMRLGGGGGDGTNAPSNTPARLPSIPAGAVAIE